MGDGGRLVGVEGAEHLGLMGGHRVQSGDLPAGEIPVAGFVFETDPHPAVGQPVGMGPPQVIDKGMLDERVASLPGQGRLAVGADVEASSTSSQNVFGDQPPRSKMIVGLAWGPTRARISSLARRSSAVSPSREATTTPAPRLRWLAHQASSSPASTGQAGHMVHRDRAVPW